MLSVVIITKNEEKNIGRCISSVGGIADEVIVVDSGSHDHTVDIARNLGAKVYNQDWLGFSDQKNYAVSLAQMDHILILDADEEVSGSLGKSIKEALRSNQCDGWKINRQTYYLGKYLHHVWHPEWRLRLFKKGKGRFEGELHERVICSGKVGKLEGKLHHFSYKSLEDQILRLVRYADKSAAIMEKQGRKFHYYNLVINPLWAFWKVLLRGGYLDGYRSLIVAVHEGVYTFLKYAFLLERSLKKNGTKLWQ